MNRSVMSATGDPTDMTLGAAIDLLSRNDGIWCACTGRPLCCVDLYRQAEALKRGAHIVVRLLADAQRLERPR